MRNSRFSSTIYWLLFVFLLLTSCQDRMDDHYGVPSWMKGNTWETLEDEGNYSIFLKGIELSGYKSMVNGKSILTVMAPNDEAFSSYLSAHGYSDITAMDSTDLKKLIGFHLLYYSYNKDKLTNFRPEGDAVTDEQAKVNAGLYYKFRTKSTSPTTMETDPSTGKNVTVYHLERFLPVFSYEFFNTKGIDAKYNYEYFYPNSTWTGSDGFNVSNASVTDYEIVANNGYIYKINQVLNPLETIYTEMKNRPNYSEFFNLYNSYSTYTYDATLSTDYGKTVGVDSLYLHEHGDLAPIALEWPITNYAAVSTLSSIAYSVFAPSNTAMNNFFNSFWAAGGYQSLNDVDPLVMKYMLYQFLYGGSLVFPEQIKKGELNNTYGLAFNFDPDAAADKAMCVNGTFYGLNQINTPPLFASVVGPAFRDMNRTSYFYALSGSGLLNSYVSQQTSFVMLMPSNSQFAQAGISLNTYTTGKVLQKLVDGVWADLSTTEKQNIVNIHTVSSETELKTSGSKVYPTQLSYNYLFVKDGKITSSALFNRSIEPDYIGTPFVNFHEVTNAGSAWSNGRVYSYDDVADGIFAKNESEGLQHTLAASNDIRYPFGAFVQLMKKAGMVSGTTITMLTDVARFVSFIPSNSAIEAAVASNKIPGIVGGSFDSDGNLTYTSLDATTLTAYLKSYFLLNSQNVIADYPYIGSSFKSGSYLTAAGRVLTYTDNGSSLTVKSGNTTVSVSSVYNYFPFAYSDGCFHIIDAIF